MAEIPVSADRLERPRDPNKPVDLRAIQDYRLEEMAKREQAVTEDTGETYRQMQARARRLRTGQVPKQIPSGMGESAADRLRATTKDYLERSGQLTEDYIPSRKPALTGEANTRAGMNAAADLLARDATIMLHRFQDARRDQDLTKFEYLNELREQAEALGQPLSDDDINNLVAWGQLESAADKYIMYKKAGMNQYAENILRTMSDPSTGNLVMASMLPTVIMEKAAAEIGFDVYNPDTLDQMVSKAGEYVGKALDVAQKPVNWFLEQQRAQEYVNQFNTSFEEALEKTKPGNFNEFYVQQLVGNPSEGKWTQLEVDLAKEVLRASLEGRTDALAYVWNSQPDPTDPETAAFFGNLMTSLGDESNRINMLMRQLMSVDLSNNAVVKTFNGADPDLEFNPARGEEWAAQMMSASNIGYQIMFDPLFLVPTPLRAGQAARWTLSKLAPGAVDKFGNPIRAIDVIGKKSIGKVTYNTGASRYFDNFAKDLNKLDDLETAAVDAANAADAAKFKDEAAVFRQRMSRRYDEMPENLIESFRNNMSRNAEGRFDLDTVAEYIDDTNDAYIQAQGKISTRFIEEGVQDQADLAAIQALLAERPLFVEAVAGTTQRRSLLVPRMGLFGSLRRNAINDIIGSVMPSGTARKILEESFDGTMSTAEIAKRLDDNFVKIGKEMSQQKGVGRWLASVPSGLVIPIDSSAGAKEFYRFARQFMNRRTASFLTDAYRQGTTASRRLLIASTVRAAFQSKGVSLTKGQLDEFMHRATGSPTSPGMSVTGSRSGEAYSVVNVDGVLPTAKLTKFREAIRAVRKARLPEGVQETLEQAPRTQATEVRGPGSISRIIDENGERRLSMTFVQFEEADEEMNALLDYINNPATNRESQEYIDAWETVSKREAYLRSIYDQEEILVDIERQFDQLPQYRRLEDGTIEPIYEEPDSGLVDRLVDQRLEEMDLPVNSAVEFERASGVYMTPYESTIFNEYGFLTEAYLKRVYKHLGKSTEAAQRIELPKMSASQRANTPQNTEPLGGLETFNFLLKRPNTDDIVQRYLYDADAAYAEGVETQVGLGEALTRLERFDPRDMNPASKIRSEMAIKRQPRGIYVPWAQQVSKYGMPRLREEVREAILSEIRDQFEEYVGPLLNKIPALERRRDEVSKLIRDRWANDLTPEERAKIQALVDDFDNDLNARINGDRPIDRAPGDPVIDIADDLNRAQDDVSWSPSRNENGMEEAIHQYQIAKSVRIPSIADVDEVRRQYLLGRKMYGANALSSINNAIGAMVDAWSFGTLFGPRFSMRNAIEEVLFYVLTGGSVSDLYRGRRASTVQREVRPRFVYEDVKQLDGSVKQQLVIKTNLGLVNRINRGYTMTGKLRDDMNQEWLAAILGPSITKEDFVKAQLAWQNGDPTAYTAMTAAVLLRQRLPMALDDRQKDALLWIAGSEQGQKFIENVAESGNSLLNGRLPSEMASMVRADELAPGEVDAMLSQFPRWNPGMSPREFGAIRPVTFDENNRMINGVWWWWRELQAITYGDGPIGKLAVKYLADPETAKKAIADAVRRDTVWRYKEDWTMFSDASDIDMAAARYYENVLRNFQKPNGEINWDLRNKFVDRVDDEDIVNWYKPRKPGNTPFDDFAKAEKVNRVSVQDLGQIPVADRPEFVFGRLAGASEPVPVLTGWEGFVTKGYGILGRQNARLSREPIYYANFLNMVDQLSPMEESMAAAIAKAGGRDQVSEIDMVLAREFTNRTAADSAYAMTMAYVDNPANRSLLAWRVRNVARYYRATEDFYRRAKRLAVNYPEAYYRGAVVYGLLDDTGFVFEDEEGVKYFYYPGNEYVQNIMRTFVSVIPGMDSYSWVANNPFGLGGKVTGLSPSLDPKSLVPTVVGPLTFPFRVAFDLFEPLKEFSGLRSLVLGPYAQPQDSLSAILLDAVTPAGVARLKELDQDQFDSTVSEAAYDTLKIMVAEGIVDPEDLANEQGALGIESFMASDKWKAAQSVAWGLAATKFIMGYVAPAAPQTIEGTVNPAARDLKISSMDTVFRQLLELNKDKPDPWGESVSMYYAAKIRKASGEPTKYDTWNSLLPFTLSGSKNTPDKLAGLAGVSASDEFTKFFFSDQFNELEALPGGKESVYWMAPRQGEFTWQSWGIITNQLGLKVPKTTEEKIESVFAAQGMYQDTQIRKTYDAIIATLDPTDPEQRKVINQLNDEKVEQRTLNEMRNPYWRSVRAETGTDYRPTRLADSVKQMEIFIGSVRDYLATDPEESGRTITEMPKTLESIETAILLWKQYSEAMSGLGQKRAEIQYKNELAAERDAYLAAIGESDENAKRFIDTILGTLNYGEYRQTNPLILPEE